MMNILCTDQSITSFAYAVLTVEDSHSRIQQYGAVKLDSRRTYFERILSLEHVLDPLVAEFRIDTFQTEDIQLQRGVTTYRKLSSLLFFLQYYAFTHSIDFLRKRQITQWIEKEQKLM